MGKQWARLALALAAAWFAFRGPYRGLGRATDFAVVYAGARVWIAGGNPYEPAALDAAWRDAGGPPDFRPGGRTAVYPPSAFVAAAPVAFLGWSAARLVWLSVCTGGYLLLAAVAARAAGGAGLWYWAAALAFAPAQTAISLGQPSLAAFGLIALAALPARWGWASGLALGGACAWKPQLGGLFVLYALCRRRWSCAATATAVAGLALALGAGRLETLGVPWRADLAANLATLSAREGGVGAGNPLRHDLIHLAVPLHAAGLPESLAGKVAALAAAALFLAAFAKPRPGPDHDPWSLALLFALLPLPVYHRIYDASGYVFIAAWAVAERRRLPLALLAPLLVPGAAILHERFPAWAEGSFAWRFLAVHPAWLAAALAAAVWFARRRTR